MPRALRSTGLRQILPLTHHKWMTPKLNHTPASRNVRFIPELQERRARLQAAEGSVSHEYLSQLLAEVDSALNRMQLGTFGICETCHDPIEEERLEINPLIRFCLDHMSREELRAHQHDLDLASRIQNQLLPRSDLAVDSWETYYHYQPAGAVGGDYCEMMLPGKGHPLFFAVGDVAGKGVAASLLMTHLSAIFRTLVPLQLSLPEMMGRANRLFCEGTSPSHYATLACGLAIGDSLQLSNAGHCPPLLVRHDGVAKFESTGLPMGLFCGSEFGIHHVALEPGDTLILYSDGITEARNLSDEEYGEERLANAVSARRKQDARTLATGVVQDVVKFCGFKAPTDDITLMAVRRV